jgi:conjugative transfer signal peptidase TraF
MAGRWSKPDLRGARVLALLSTGVFGTVFLSGTAGIRINPSPSVPVGLYVVSSNPDAPLVEFCPDGQAGRISRDRGYRTRGSCPDGAAPLLKGLVAQPGDLIRLSSSGIAVNGRLLPNTAPRAVDSAGRVLPRWPLGEYRVAAGMAWVVSTTNPLSFDSRYFGPINAGSILHHLEPLWTFGN